LTKCAYCGMNDAVDRLVVADACRSCARTVWKMFLASHGREAQ